MKVDLVTGDTTELGEVPVGGCFEFIYIPEAVRDYVGKDTAYYKAELHNKMSEQPTGYTMCIRLSTGKACYVRDNTAVSVLEQLGTFRFKR